MDVQTAGVGTGLRHARILVAAVFLAHGGLFASWTPQIPELKSELHLSHAQLGAALLGAPFGSVIAMIVTGVLIARWGSRPVMIGALVAYCTTAGLVGLADSATGLFGLLAVWGAGQGSLDVAMNSQAVAVEREYRRPVLASFHACWSIGAFAGTVLGVLAVSWHIGLAVQLATLGLLALACLLPAARLALPAASEALSSTGQPRRLPWLLIVLGVMAFAEMLSEGAVADWSAVYLREQFEVGAGLAGGGYAAYTLSMFVGRLSSDRLVDRFGSVLAVRLHAATAVLGLAAALLTSSRLVALLGFGLLGLGLSGVVPAIFSAAGRIPDRTTGGSLATVASFGWAGYVCGPPVIGALATAFSLRTALLLVVALTVVVFAMAAAVRR